MADVRATRLCKSFGAVEVLKDIDLDVPSGEFVVFVGPSGCGKSTLLRCISGLEEITSGTLEIDGQVVNEVPPAKRGIAMVFQSYALYPHMTVFGNIAFGLEMAGWKKAAIRRRVEEVAATLQLSQFLHRLPKALSGGQRQRVAIGRAIVRDPKVFLFDEPLSNLDAALRVQMRIELANLKKKMANTTMIYVTHDQVEAMTMADRIVVLNAGRIEQVGAPIELYERPANLFVAGFIGSPKMNFISGRPAEAYGTHTIGVRPEHLRLADGSAGWPVEVLLTERLGNETILVARSDEIGEVKLRLEGDAVFRDGERLRVAPLPDRVIGFDRDGSAVPTRAADPATRQSDAVMPPST